MNAKCLALSAVVLLASFSPRVALQAAKPNSASCEMTFTDTGNNITSDGGGTYRDGFYGVSCAVGGVNDNNIKMTLASNRNEDTLHSRIFHQPCCSLFSPFKPRDQHLRDDPTSREHAMGHHNLDECSLPVQQPNVDTQLVRRHF